MVVRTADSGLFDATLCADGCDHANLILSGLFVVHRAAPTMDFTWEFYLFV